MRPVPVFLIEDNRLLRDGLSSLLTVHGVTVVAAAPSGLEAMRELARRKPALVLVDAALGERDSTRFVQDIRLAFPDTRVIVMGLLPEQADFVEFVRAGVAGFILKDATIEVFVSTILSVADGMSVLPALLARALFTHVVAQVRFRGKRGANPEAQVTARERQVIQSIAEGKCNKEIAVRLQIATHTVKSHVHNILEKLALHTRLEIAAYAHEQEGAYLVAA